MTCHVKQSGLGREQGRHGLDELLEVKHLRYRLHMPPQQMICCELLA
jgi:acyl-CoA reductase-like NAD-dependent aldehyde dehydrogenase